jgi:hypothetical protein
MQTSAPEINPFLFLSGIEKERHEYNATAALGGF